MIDHDRLFKELLSTFFVEFLELFFPDLSTGLVHDSVRFLDKEIFTDVTSGERYEADPKQHTFTTELGKASFFPTDVDAAAPDLEHGVSVDSIDLESYPDFGKLHIEPETFYRISEDDFELLAEALTEITEDEEEEVEEYEEDDEDEVE